MSNKKPMILVIAGPNGSGKSTFTRYFETVGEYTNADDVVAATGMDNMEAARLVDKNAMLRLKVKWILPSKRFFRRTIRWKYCERQSRKGIS